jgi:hypothetical protein
MSDLLNLFQLPSGLSLGSWTSPSQLILVVLIYTAVATYVITRIVSGARSVTGPVTFWVLFSCAIAANKYLIEYRIPGTVELQNQMIFTTAGVTVGSLFLLLVFRVASRGEG